MTNELITRNLQKTIWSGSIPLQITLAPSECRTYDESDPYLIQVPRLSYLPFLLPRLHSFFLNSLIDISVTPNQGWFSFEGVSLKWQHPVGLLYDLFSGAEPTSSYREGEESTERLATDNGQEDTLPWKLELHFADWPSDQLILLDVDFKVQHDAFINSVKEADFLRNGTAKVIMGLSMDDSAKLWQSVQYHNLEEFNSVNQKLLNPPGIAIRHVPVKVYLPTTSGNAGSLGSPPQGSVRVVQSLVTPMASSREPQTVGSVLHHMLPTVFPSRRSPIHAQAVLHGAVLPLNAAVQELMRSAAYLDGFLHIAVVMVS